MKLLISTSPLWYTTTDMNKKFKILRYSFEGIKDSEENKNWFICGS